MSKRKIAVVSGTRADYGLLYWLLRELQDDPGIDLQMLVTGMHLSPEFGSTYRVIEEDGFPIAARVEMLLSSDTPVGITKSLGLATLGFADALARLQPDILVVLGDRYEILAAAQAAMVARIPIAHIHGGESTEGAIDEAIRHAVTKMAHMHFAAAEPYRQRIIQLGEHPGRVYNFGAPGLDNFNRLSLISRQELSESLGFDLSGPFFLVTYHPATLDHRGPRAATQSLLDALDRFPAVKILFTKSNSDTDGRIIGRMIDAYVAAHPERAIASTSLGQTRYLSALTHASVVIGNSSSGIIEAPVARTPTVNIGSRQRGRLRAESILDCDESPEAISQAIALAISPGFQAIVSRAQSPYGDGKASPGIKAVLATINLQDLLLKYFHDLPNGS